MFHLPAFNPAAPGAPGGFRGRLRCPPSAPNGAPLTAAQRGVEKRDWRRNALLTPDKKMTAGGEDCASSFVFLCSSQSMAPLTTKQKKQEILFVGVERGWKTALRFFFGPGRKTKLKRKKKNSPLFFLFISRRRKRTTFPSVQTLPHPISLLHCAVFFFQERDSRSV